jgi:hypothetical protein
VQDAPVQSDDEDFEAEWRRRVEMRMSAGSAFLRQNPLVGLGWEEAGHRAREAGLDLRAVDVARPIFSGDMRPGRITVMVDERGVVVSAEVGN